MSAIEIFLAVSIPLLTVITVFAYQHPKVYCALIHFAFYPLTLWLGFSLGSATGLPNKAEDWIFGLAPVGIGFYLGMLTLIRDFKDLDNPKKKI